MQCPKCQGELEAQIHENITIDRCNRCFGLLVLPAMLEAMRDNFQSEKFLDIGSYAMGVKYDKIEDIDCPYCGIRMDKIEDPVQTHIWMESCSRCGRIFMDAGEFSDLKYETFRDRFKAIAKGRRNS